MALKFTNESSIIQGIKEQNEEVLAYVYKKYFSAVRRFVFNNQGGMQDAKDIFQEAIVVLYRKIVAGEYDGSKSGVKTFLVGIARFLWLKELKNRRIEEETTDTYGYLEVNPEITDNEYEKNRRFALYQKHFMALGEECQKVLQLVFDDLTYKEIAEKLNYASEKFVKKKKYRCKEQLIRRIKEDPEFDENEE
jgi:RNA polymerase sigma factor (sigma-70 family)